MFFRYLVGLSIVLLIACSTVNSNSSLVREGVGYKNMQLIEDQLSRGEGFNEPLAQETELLFTEQHDVLGSAELNYLKGVYHYLIMKADNTDQENLELSSEYLHAAKKAYRKLGEQWLEAKSGFFLTLAYARASQYPKACEYYKETVALLESGKGQLKDFDYDTEAFQTPQGYVQGMFEDTCQIVSGMIEE